MEETHTVSPWLYRLLPVAAVLVVVWVIAFPLVRRSFRFGGVQVAVIPERSENGVEPRQPLAGQPEKSGSLPRLGNKTSTIPGGRPRHEGRRKLLRLPSSLVPRNPTAFCSWRRLCREVRSGLRQWCIRLPSRRVR